jgi:hypothetical protein
MTIRRACCLLALGLTIAGCGGSGSPGGTASPAQRQAGAVHAFAQTVTYTLGPLTGPPHVTCRRVEGGWRCAGSGVQKLDGGGDASVSMSGTVGDDGTVIPD